MTPIPDVIVVGGGIVGSACARSLAARGAAVTLIQRADTPGEGWRAAAGMLAAQIESRPDDPMLALSVAGRAFYRRSAPDLLESTGIDIGLSECGILQVARTESDVVNAKAKVARQRQQAHRADWLSADEIREGWPWLDPGLGGFWSPEDGSVDPVRTVGAFRLDAERSGTRLVADTALAITHAAGRLAGVRGERDTYRAGHVVIAGGAWSGRLTGLPRPLSVEPIRGQMVSYPWPAHAATTVVYGSGCYLLRRGDEMLVGATMEHAGFDVEVTPEGIDAVTRAATAIYPQLASQSPTRAWSGLRPGTPDGLPIIGREPRLDGLWYATGHGRNGVLLAGVTAELVAQQLTGDAEGSDAIDLSAVRPERFWSF
jgi:glycine oxidase